MDNYTSLIITNHLFKLETLHRKQFYRNKRKNKTKHHQTPNQRNKKGGKIQLVCFKFIEMLDFKGIQRKEICTGRRRVRKKGKVPDFILKTI